jgi:hypothetical protein
MALLAQACIRHGQSRSDYFHLGPYSFAQRTRFQNIFALSDMEGASAFQGHLRSPPPFCHVITQQIARFHSNWLTVAVAVQVQHLTDGMALRPLLYLLLLPSPPQRSPSLLPPPPASPSSSSATTTRRGAATALLLLAAAAAAAAPAPPRPASAADEDVDEARVVRLFQVRFPCLVFHSRGALP